MRTFERLVLSSGRNATVTKALRSSGERVHLLLPGKDAFCWHAACCSPASSSCLCQLYARYALALADANAAAERAAASEAAAHLMDEVAAWRCLLAAFDAQHGFAFHAPPGPVAVGLRALRRALATAFGLAPSSSSSARDGGDYGGQGRWVPNQALIEGRVIESLAALEALLDGVAPPLDAQGTTRDWEGLTIGTDPVY